MSTYVQDKSARGVLQLQYFVNVCAQCQLLCIVFAIDVNEVDKVADCTAVDNAKSFAVSTLLTQHPVLLALLIGFAVQSTILADAISTACVNKVDKAKHVLCLCYQQLRMPEGLICLPPSA